MNKSQAQSKPLSGWAQGIKLKRKQLGETQAEFAARFDVTYVAVSLWENGKRDIPDRVTWWLVKNPVERDQYGNAWLPCDGSCINHPYLDHNGEVSGKQ